jgi:hypothetical protein
MNFVLLLGVQAVGVSRLSLAEHLRCVRGAHAPNLVLQGNEGAAQIAIGPGSYFEAFVSPR